MLTSDLGADRVYVHHWEHGELVREGESCLSRALARVTSIYCQSHPMILRTIGAWRSSANGVARPLCILRPYFAILFC